ncbi:MAG: hypothetical protein JSS27_01780 [Planctomycetes bacterium]|nr:hypothetical protein [Planctomycetota bacterium]
MTTPQLPLADSELLSAYLDNELSAADRARTEALLAENPGARQLLDELDAQRAQLRQISRDPLGVDFAQRVLRAAEREVLVPSAKPSEAAAKKSATAEPALRPAREEDRPRWLRLPAGRRPWVYVALASAAAVVMMIFNPSRDRNVDQVAVLPANMEMSATRSEEQFARHLNRADKQEANAPVAESMVERRASDVAGAPAATGPAPAAMAGATTAAVPATPAAPASNAAASTAPAAGVGGAFANVDEQQWVRASLEPLGLDRYTDEVMQQASAYTAGLEPGFANDNNGQMLIICCDVNRTLVPPPQVATWLAQSDIEVTGGSSLGENEALAAKAPAMASSATKPNSPSQPGSAPQTGKAAKPDSSGVSISSLAAQIHAPVPDSDPDNVALSSEPTAKRNAPKVATTPPAKPAMAAAAAAPQKPAASGPQGQVTPASSDQNVQVFYCLAPREQVSAAVELLRNQTNVVTNVHVLTPTSADVVVSATIAPDRDAAARNGAPANAPAAADRKQPAAQAAPSAGNQLGQQQNRNRGYGQRIVLADEADNKAATTNKLQRQAGNAGDDAKTSPQAVARAEALVEGQRARAQLGKGRAVGVDNAATLERALFVFRMVTPETPAQPTAAPAEAKPVKSP